MKISNDTIMIITGAAGGFGRALIDEYAPKGASIHGTYLSSQKTAENLEKQYPNVKMSKVDSRNSEDIEKFVKKVVDENRKIDVLINNAGSIHEREEIVDLSLDNFRNLLEVHVVATFLYCKNVLPNMIEKDKGVIVNVASRFGLFEWAKEGFGALNVAKAGMNMLTKVLFQELQNTKIRVNSILPAPIATNFLTTVFSQKELESMKERGILGELYEFVQQVNETIEDNSLNGEFLLSDRLK